MCTSNFLAIPPLGLYHRETLALVAQRHYNVQSSSVGDNKNAGKSLNAHQKVMQINYTAYSNTGKEKASHRKRCDTVTLLKARKESGKTKKASILTQTNKQ